MLKWIMIAITLVAVGLPSFAADALAHEEGSMKEMRPYPGMQKEMMRNPQHPMMMAYHKNLMTFCRMLEKVARQGETVPRDIARTAIAEMRRSADEIEKYRAGFMAKMPPDMKGNPEMQKKMDRHLVNVKMQLRQLEELAQNDRIQSQEVIRHLESIFEECEGMACGAPHAKGMHGKWRHNHDAYGCDCMHGCGCRDMGCKDMGCQEMMSKRHKIMADMIQKLKAQDAELATQVESMKRAPKDRKVDLIADIVARMAQQRAELNSYMEEVQKHMSDRQGTSMQQPSMMHRSYGNDADEDEDMDNNTDDDMNDMDMQDMDMQDMNMED